MALISLARWTQPNLAALAAKCAKPQLLTIPYSHFCELGAWSLRAASIEYDEHAFAPGQHVLPLLALRLAGSSRHLAKTSAVTAVEAVEAEAAPLQQSKAYKPHFATAVPACCLPDGRVLVDSWAIMRASASHAGLPPPAEDLQSLLDEEVGPLVRQVLYSIIFRPQNRATWNGLVTQEGGLGWSLAWKMGIGRRITDRMVTLFRSDDPKASAKGRELLHEALAKVEQRHLEPVLKNMSSGRGGDGPRFLGGSKPGYADIAIAALTAPMVLPPLYAGGKYGRWFDALMERDDAARKEVEHFRATPVGAHCLRVYDACRMKPLL